MAEVTFAWEREFGDRYRPLLSYKGVPSIQLDCPKQLNISDPFTIFWRGHATPQDLHHFVNYSRRDEDRTLRTLFFFSQAHLDLPPHPMTSVPSPLEHTIIGMYGFPQFLRYEIYPANVMSHNLQQTHYIVWAAVATPEQKMSESTSKNEIGVFTNLLRFDQGGMDGVADFIAVTIKPNVESDIVREFINVSLNRLRDKVRP